MTLAELSTAWNDLRNSVLGEGLQSRASEELSDLTASEYSDWRAFYEQASTSDDMFTSVTAREWVDRYREVLAQAQAEGLAPKKVLPSTPVEKFAEGVGTSIALAVGAFVLALVVPVLASQYRKGRR